MRGIKELVPLDNYRNQELHITTIHNKTKSLLFMIAFLGTIQCTTCKHIFSRHGFKTNVITKAALTLKLL
jgi:hypothetical protein